MLESWCGWFHLMLTGKEVIVSQKGRNSRKELFLYKFDIYDGWKKSSIMKLTQNLWITLCSPQQTGSYRSDRCMCGFDLEGFHRLQSTSIRESSSEWWTVWCRNSQQPVCNTQNLESSGSRQASWTGAEIDQWVFLNPARPSQSFLQDQWKLSLLPQRLLACPLTSIMSNYFERLVEHHTTSIPPTFDPSQFSYQPNRSTEGKIPFVLQLSLAYLEDNASHARMLFLDFSWQ